MILKRIKVLTELQAYTNCYIIQDEITKETMVVDPGGEVDKIVEMLDILKAKLKYIYLTHCHGDHIGGVMELKERKGGIILIHRYDAEGLFNDSISLTTYIGMKATVNGNELKFDEKTYTLVDRETEESGYSWLFIKGTGKTRDGTDSSYKDYEGLGFVGYAPVGCFTSPPNSKKVIKLHFTYEGDISNAYILYCEKM